jgi:uncharacterized protein YlxP (DUF503 family)
MKLLKYTNTTNPNAHINGCCILTDAEVQTLIAKRAEIKALITDRKKFITRVGEGFIPFATGTELEVTVSIANITAAEATRLTELGIAETGFARHFVDGVLNWLESSFVDVFDEEIVP